MNSLNGNFKRKFREAYGLFEEHVELLNDIVEETDAKICLISSWRLGESIDSLKNLFNRNGINPNRLIGKTQSLLGKRGIEVFDWIENCPVQIESFCILDDNSDFTPVQDHLVQTTFNYGLTHIEKLDVIVMLLRIKKIDYIEQLKGF